MSTAILILLIFTTAQTRTNKIAEVMLNHTNNREFQQKFAYEVVKKVNKNFQQWFFTIILCDYSFFENRIIKHIETYGYGNPVMIHSGCPNSGKVFVKPKIDNHGATAYIVTSNQLSLDINDGVITALKKTGVWKPRTILIFVISRPFEIDAYFNFDMQNHFYLLWSKRITKSILIVWSGHMKIFGYNRYLKRIQDLTYSRNISQILDKQFQNLYGNEMRLSVFRKVYLSDDTNQVDCEAKLTKTVMQYLNASCTAFVPRDGNTVGDLLENETATGVTADLLDGYTDMELNSRILKNSYYGYIDTTYPLSQDNLCFIVSKAPRLSNFMTVIRIITKNILGIFLFNVIALTAVAVIVRRQEKLLMNIEDVRTTGEVVVDVIKCFIRQTVDIKFTGPIFRFVILMIMLYSLIVDCVIDGIVTSAITYPRYKEDLNLLRDLQKSNLTFAIHNRHMNIFLSSLDNETYNAISHRIINVNDKTIKKIFDDKLTTYAVLLRHSDGEFICKKPSNKLDGIPLFHVMNQCPVPSNVVYGLRFGSPHLPRINYLLFLLDQAGILNHWSQADKIIHIKDYSKKLYAGTKQNKPLSMKILREVFYVWISGIAISVCTFIVELIINSCNFHLCRFKLCF